MGSSNNNKQNKQNKQVKQTKQTYKQNKTKKKPFKNISQEEEKKFKKVNKGKKKETKQTTATKKSIKSNKIIYIYIKCFVHRFSLQFSLRLNRTFFQTNTLLKKTNFISPFYSIGPLFLFVYVLFLSTATTHTKKSEKKSCFFFLVCPVSSVDVTVKKSVPPKKVHVQSQ